MSALTVCLDGGHGGQHKSNVGVSGTYYEHECVLDIALRCKRYLETMGHKVIMTRDTDETVFLPDRLARARKGKADCFVSIHTNAAVNNEPVNGYEVFYSAHNGKSKILSDAIEKQLAHTGRKSRGSKYWLLKDNSGRDHLYLHREANGLPVALVECEFHSNVEAEAWLKTSEARSALAYQIALGVKDYALTLEGSGAGMGNNTGATGNLAYNGATIARGLPVIDGTMYVGATPLREVIAHFGVAVGSFTESTQTANLIDVRTNDLTELKEALAQAESAVQTMRKEVEKL